MTDASKGTTEATNTGQSGTKDVSSTLREEKVGIWTMYFAPPPQTPTHKNPGPSVGLLDGLYSSRGVALLRSIYRFILDAISIGPVLFAVYFGTSAASSLVPVLQLGNNARLLELVQSALLKKQPTTRDDFIFALVSYISLVALGWMARKAKSHTEPILQQRLALHFKKQILAVQTQLDMSTANNPAVNAKVQTAIAFSEHSWRSVEGIVTIVSIAAGSVGQASILSKTFGLHWDVPLLLLMCVAQPLLSSLKLQSYIGMQGYYAMITNKNWLRMNALFELGTNNSYKKEVLGSNLGSYIRSAYEKEMEELGDTSGEKPEIQLWKNDMFDAQDQQAIFQPLPLILFAYRSMSSDRELNLSSLFLMQQASTAIEHSVLHALHSLSMFSGVFQDISGLYDVLDMLPAMEEGTTCYPEEQFVDSAGMAVEFKSVCFTYPHSKRQVLSNMSFSIPAGKLCVIVGENGCGKSTTVQLLTRLYDANAGEVLIDQRPIRDFTLASIRSAASVMYQDYKHLPLTVYENILLGRPNSSHPQEEVERAAALGGAYNLIQRLPEIFQTNLKPQNMGYSLSHSGTDSAGPFSSLINAQKAIELSGGEWQRLALSRSFMKNSSHVKLLCYDEPSASLDPKAEQELFERLRNLRGEKTMIFVTHRFGYLTKHADLILYMSEGTIIEHGAHQELLEKDGSYAKMYNIQAQAFL